MQYLNMRNAHGLLLALALVTAGTQSAHAIGTPSGTLISNTATVDYQVNTSARSASGAAPDITVDNRVDLTVVNNDALNNVTVVPGSTNQVLTYTVTNTGNTTQGYLLSTLTPTANIPMGNIRIYIETAFPANGFDAADTLYVTGTNAGNLDPNGVLGQDDVMTVYVVADTPATALDSSFDDFRLVAQSAATTAAAGDPTTALVASGGPITSVVDIVFADLAGTDDAARDGQFSAAATYTVSSAALTVTKSILSTTDAFGTGFAIPGAAVQYQLRVANSGTAVVDNNTVVVTDQVPANTKVCVAAACGGAPSFVDGALTSGLTQAAFEYSTAAAPDQCAPASFVGYTPTADADGADAAVTCIRQAPTGSMNGTAAFFDIRFNVVIK